MAEYIEREAIQKRINRIVEVNNLRTDLAWFTPYGVKALIEEIPAADVVPVVRCDDCINFTCGENESERWEWCILWGHDVSHGNYCSYGTKMDKDGSE